METVMKTLAAAAAVVTMSAAQVTLVDRGGGMIYDDVLNVTWLADMNCAQSSGYASTNARDFDRNQIEHQGLYRGSAYDLLTGVAAALHLET